ncbi:MAG TPA: DUF6624 domain-containing protein [Blastocatellia bacterium]|nr:DUF6624 domain-containing protein [Blastocatellia bacterium]
MRRSPLAVLILVVLIGGYAGAQETQAPAVANPALRKELLSRLEEDQAIRNEMIAKGGFQPGNPLFNRMIALDAQNTAWMKTVVVKHGWPGPELVGKDGTEAAFLLVQHAEHSFQKEMLPLVRDAYRANKLSGQDYALLLDRVLVRDGKPQIYGTQAKSLDKWKGNEPVFDPIEDEANVDRRRAEVGLPPMAAYVKALKEMYFPKDKQK